MSTELSSDVFYVILLLVSRRQHLSSLLCSCLWATITNIIYACCLDCCLLIFVWFFFLLGESFHRKSSSAYKGGVASALELITSTWRPVIKNNVIMKRWLFTLTFQVQGHVISLPWALLTHRGSDKAMTWCSHLCEHIYTNISNTWFHLVSMWRGGNDRLSLLWTSRKALWCKVSQFYYKN